MALALPCGPVEMRIRILKLESGDGEWRWNKSYEVEVACVKDECEGDWLEILEWGWPNINSSLVMVMANILEVYLVMVTFDTLLLDVFLGLGLEAWWLSQLLLGYVMPFRHVISPSYTRITRFATYGWLHRRQSLIFTYDVNKKNSIYNLTSVLHRPYYYLCFLRRALPFSHCLLITIYKTYKHFTYYINLIIYEIRFYVLAFFILDSNGSVWWT